MGRYKKIIKVDQPIDVVSMAMDDFIYHNGFSRTDWNGEMVFCSDRHSGKPWYLKWSYAAGVLSLEAWTKGLFGGENGIGSAGNYKNKINRLILEIKSHTGEQTGGGHVGSDPLHHEEEHGGNHETWAQDTKWQEDVPWQDEEDTPASGSPFAIKLDYADEETDASSNGDSNQPTWQINGQDVTGDIGKQIANMAGVSGKQWIYIVMALIFGGPAGAIVVYGILKAMEKKGNTDKNATLTVVIVLIVVFAVMRVYMAMN